MFRLFQQSIFSSVATSQNRNNLSPFSAYTVILKIPVLPDLKSLSCDSFRYFESISSGILMRFSFGSECFETALKNKFKIIVFLNCPWNTAGIHFRIFPKWFRQSAQQHDIRNTEMSARFEHTKNFFENFFPFSGTKVEYAVADYYICHRRTQWHFSISPWRNSTLLNFNFQHWFLPFQSWREWSQYQSLFHRVRFLIEQWNNHSLHQNLGRWQYLLF